jgi:hypothetical protein
LIFKASVGEQHYFKAAPATATVKQIYAGSEGLALQKISFAGQTKF